MKRRKAIVGLSVLCALCLCAFSAASASAAGTTLFECASGAGKKDFSDAHCDKPVPEGTGSFGHKEIANGISTTVTAANDLTETASPFILRGKLAGILTEVECTTVTGSGTATNEVVSGVMKIKFGTAKTEFTKCAVKKPVATGCSVAEPIITESVETDPMNLKISTTKRTLPEGGETTFHEENAEGTEMGLKFAPTAASGGVFTTITFSAACPEGVKGAKKVEGSAICTGGRGSTAAITSSGATCVFSKSSTVGKFGSTTGLIFGGNGATLEGTLTFRNNKVNPVTITTTAT